MLSSSYLFVHLQSPCLGLSHDIYHRCHSKARDDNKKKKEKRKKKKEKRKEKMKRRKRKGKSEGRIRKNRFSSTGRASDDSTMNVKFPMYCIPYIITHLLFSLLLSLESLVE